MSDNAFTPSADRTPDAPIRICPRTRWACPLWTHCQSCGGRYARPCDRPEKLARLLLKVRATDRFRGHAGTAEQNLDRVGLECVLGDALWDECRLIVLEDAGCPDDGGWDDPRVRQAAHDLYDDLVANARRATDRGDYARRPQPADDADPDDAPPAGGGAAFPTGCGLAARSGDFAWSLLAGAIRQARRLDAHRAA